MLPGQRIREILKDIYSEDEISRFLRAEQKLLGGATPLYLIQNGRADEVEAVIDRLLSGAYL